MTASTRHGQPAGSVPWPRSRSTTVLVAATTTAWLLAGCGASDDPADAASIGESTSAIDTETASETAAASPSTASEAAPSTASTDPASQQYPDVLAVEPTATGDTWTIAATISSPYDTPQRYADAFRVLAEDGTVMGIRELAHDHAAEQPFTRSLSDVAIPAEVTSITVEGRDQANGWGGDTVTVDLPR